MGIYKTLHKDVLFAMANGLLEQYEQGHISKSDLDAQAAVIVSEIQERQEADRVHLYQNFLKLQKDFNRLLGEQQDTQTRHVHEIGIYEAFLEEKGLSEEFEKFEHQWIMNRGRQGVDGTE